jgi:hypothetical protein
MTVQKTPWTCSNWCTRSFTCIWSKGGAWGGGSVPREEAKRGTSALGGGAQGRELLRTAGQEASGGCRLGRNRGGAEVCCRAGVKAQRHGGEATRAWLARRGSLGRQGPQTTGGDARRRSAARAGLPSVGHCGGVEAVLRRRGRRPVEDGRRGIAHVLRQRDGEIAAAMLAEASRESGA